MHHRTNNQRGRGNNEFTDEFLSKFSPCHLSASNLEGILHCVHCKDGSHTYDRRGNILHGCAQHAGFTSYGDSSGHCTANKSLTATLESSKAYALELLFVKITVLDEVVDSLVDFWCYIQHNRNRCCGQTGLECLLCEIFKSYDFISGDT